MEVDDEDDDDWSEVLDRDTSAASRPRDVAPIDPMEVGNPWDSAGAVASSPTHETSFDVAFNSPPPAKSATAAPRDPFSSEADSEEGSKADVSGKLLVQLPLVSAF